MLKYKIPQIVTLTLKYGQLKQFVYALFTQGKKKGVTRFVTP